MTDERGGGEDPWGGSAFDDRPAPPPEQKAGDGGSDAGTPPDENAAPGKPEAGKPVNGGSESSTPEGERPEQPAPDPFAEKFRARESRGGQEARREQAAGARYNTTNYYYHYENGGPAVGGIRVGPVDARELADARRDFHAPDFYPSAAEMLERRGMVVLAYGLSDREKRWAALNLLGSCAEPVAEIDPRADLGGLAAFAFEPAGRYLAMVATDAAARALGQFALDRLRERLAACGSRLVLVVTSGLRVASEELGDYGVVCGNPVQAWFDAEQRDLSEYALMLGVAVLGGISHQAVVDEADRLHRSLAEETDAETTTRRIFGTVRDQRAAAVKARVRATMDETEFGDVPVKIVEFLHEKWYSAVLHYVWEHKELMRPPLLRWMEDLCVRGDDDVRLGAATAAGDLCCHDFGYMWPHVIVRWARSDDRALRRAAAWAAGIAAWDTKLAPHVRGWLEKWSEDDDDPALRWTAAAAFGSYWLGRRFPDEALRVLGTMLEKEPKLGFHISEGMGVLFEADREANPKEDHDAHEIAAKVLRALIQWSADRRRTPASLGIFCNIAYGNERPRRAMEGAGWPSVLWLGDRHAETREGIVTLFRRSLADPAAKAWAIEVIEHWTRRTDEEPGLERALGSLLRDLSVTHREWRQLTIHLRRMASKRAERPSHAASRLLARLMAAEPVAAH
jgi:hypothetical protein